MALSASFAMSSRMPWMDVSTALNPEEVGSLPLA